MKLVELAEEFGISNEKVLKFQRTMALKMDFRMLAVQKVLTNKGKGNRGTENIFIESDKDKRIRVE